MAITRPTLTYAREGGSRDGSSPTESFGVDESTADRIIRVPWDERLDAVVHFLGYSRFATDGLGAITHLERLTPRAHPDIAFMFATRTPGITGWQFTAKRSASDGTVGNQFTKAHVPLGYEHVPYVVKEDFDNLGGNAISAAEAEYERFTYVSAVRPNADYLSLPTGALRYITTAGGATRPHAIPVPYGIGKIIGLTQIDLKWVNLPYGLYSLVTPSPWQNRIWGKPSTSIVPLIGRINKNQLFGWAPGTALLENVSLEVRKHPTIGLSWDVTFHFVINTNADGKGWNWLYYFDAESPGTHSGWNFVGKGTTHHNPGSVPVGYSLYDEAELENCWNVVAP